MTIIDLLTPIVAALNTADEGQESNAPLFLYGPKSFQNLKDDVDVTNGVVYLDEPIVSQDSLKTSGYLEEKYQLGILFGYRGGMDLVPTDERVLIDKARERRRMFINLLSLSKIVRRITNVRTTDITKEYDLSLSGCFIQFDLTPINQLSNCTPEMVEAVEEAGEISLGDTEGLITLSESGLKDINKYLWCFSLLDCNYSGTAPNFVNRNVLDPAFKQIISDLNPTALQYAGGGGRANAEQVVVGRTDYTDGGGMNCTDCSLADGLCCPTSSFTQDWFLVNVELCKQLGIGLDLSANPQLPDGDWQDQIEWKLEYMATQGVPAMHIIFGLEEVDDAYDVYWLGHAATTNADFDDKANAYATKVDAEMVSLQTANPDTTFYLDTSGVEKTTPRHTHWNDGLTGYTNDGVRQYMNLNNLLENSGQALSSVDWVHNLNVINTLVRVIATQRLDALQETPNKKIGIFQRGLRNPNVNPNLENTVLGMLLDAKITKMMLDYNYANDDVISYASYQSLNQFISKSNVVQNFGKALMLQGKMFTGAVQYVPLTLALGDSVEGFAGYNGTDYRIFIINEGAATVTADTGIMIGASPVAQWTRESYKGTALRSAFTHESATESTINIPAFSISVLTPVTP